MADEQLILSEPSMPDYERDLADIFGWMDRPQVMMGKTVKELME